MPDDVELLERKTKTLKRILLAFINVLKKKDNMKKLIIVLAFALAGTVGNANASLIDLGNGLVHNEGIHFSPIDWTRDANLGGLKNWSDAVSWANDLVVGDYSDFRLPTLNELVWGVYAQTIQAGLPSTPIVNLQFGNYYWTGFETDSTTNPVPGGPAAMAFYFGGHQIPANKSSLRYVWAVRDTREVPEPASLILLGMGLLGLRLVRRRS